MNLSKLAFAAGKQVPFTFMNKSGRVVILFYLGRVSCFNGLTGSFPCFAVRNLDKNYTVRLTIGKINRND